MRGLAVSFVRHGRIVTSVAKAKALRPFVERLITRSKKPTLANRRHLLRILVNTAAVDKLCKDLGPRFASRQGGYTRITKLNRRAGDAGPTAIIELV